MVRTIVYIDGFKLFLTARQFTRRQDGQLRRNEEPSIKGQLPFAAQIIESHLSANCDRPTSLRDVRSA